MRGDLAALTPPLVMAVAFIAGVIVLLRKEMSPRRHDHMTPQQEADLPLHGEPSRRADRGSIMCADDEPSDLGRQDTAAADDGPVLGDDCPGGGPEGGSPGGQGG